MRKGLIRHKFEKIYCCSSVALSLSLHVHVSFVISSTRLCTPSRLSIPISRASRRASERAVAAARCVLLKSGKKENIDDDDDDGPPSGESDWSEEDGRTDVGEIMEKSVIGKLGNKPPTNAYVKLKKIKNK